METTNRLALDTDGLKHLFKAITVGLVGFEPTHHEMNLLRHTASVASTFARLSSSFDGNE